MDRKQFIHASARWGLLVSLAALVGLLISKNRISTDPNCSPEQCSQCRLKGKCPDVNP